ncbi:MAG: NAD-binding protein [Candidatus Peribacteria bacterium]|nr:MAG: NAD-binding protein [Candidatus Peribacteria bacterium]
MERNDLSYLVIDHNPNLIRPMAMKEVPYIFADATNIELYKEYLSKNTKLVVSTIKDYDDDREIIKTTKKANKKTSVMVVASDIAEALTLYDRGADYVIMPEHISANHAGLLLEEV